MLPNGYVIDGLVLTAKITNQMDGLFHAMFVVKVPGMGKTAMAGVGYLGPDGKLKAVWNYEGQVVGIAEAWVDTSTDKWTMEGVGIDFSDGSMDVFKLIKKK